MIDRFQAPPTLEVKVPNIPQASKVMLGKGIPLYYLNQGEQEVLALEIEIPVGRQCEPYPGVAYFTARMMAEGTLHKSSKEIAEIFDFYGGHFEVTPTLDSVIIKLYSLKKFFRPLLDVLVEMFTEAAFPKKEFDTIKQIRIQQIRQQLAKNNTYADLKLRESLLGCDHPFGRIIDEERVNAIDIEMVSGFYQRFLSSPNLYLAGQVDNQDLKAVQNAFANVPVYAQSSSGLPEPGQQEQKLSEIKREGSTQASLRYGQMIISRDHPDTHKLKIMNALFGGFFGSRLMKNIRETKGLTYGIHSSFVHLRGLSYWYISSEVLKDKVSQTREEVHNEIKLMQEEAPGLHELQKVTSYMKGKFITSFDSPFSSLNMVRNQKSANLDDHYYQNFLQTIENITPGEIQEMASKYLNYNKLLAFSVT